MGFWIFGKKKNKKEKKVEETKVETKKEEKVEVAEEVPAKGETEVKTKENTTKKTTVKKEAAATKTTKKIEPKSNKKEEPAKEEVVEEKTRKAPSKKVYHVSLRKEDGKWQVKYGGGKKAIKLFDTQAEAIKFAEERADSQEGSISIHKKDGKIRKQDYSKKAEDKESK